MEVVRRKCTLIKETSEDYIVYIKSIHQKAFIPKTKGVLSYKDENRMTGYKQAVIEIEKQYWNEINNTNKAK